METEETPVELTKVQKVKEFLKKNGIALTSTVITLGITGWAAYDKAKRENRKEQGYYDYLEEKTELQRDALSAYKDSLESEAYDNKEME